MLYKNKRDWIIKYVQNNKVLDLGCIDHSLDNMQTANWLHGFIVKHARSVLGVDILQKEIDTLKQQGYDVVCANVEKLVLADKFEVIVAGDLIEHLSNPGLFMDRASDLLDKDGVFLITTPNPVSLIRFLQLFLLRRMDVNAEHTCWFTPQVITELARRSHFRITDIAYIDNEMFYQNQYYPTRSILAWPVLIVNYLMCRIRPQLSETLCFVFQHES